jgi:4-hydroxy-4-methyl-2-oxoglutarate aldolase
MHIQPTREELIELTPLNPFDRFPDGRPKVPDSLLDRLTKTTTEQAWDVMRHQGYNFQFEGNWRESHPGRVTVGRAVTAQFLPYRPDFHAVIDKLGISEGRRGEHNSWVIESLQHRDCMVVDIFGKVKEGSVVGDNLGTAVQVRTGTGAVIDGGIRDYQGLVRLNDVNFYFRDMDPTAIANVTLAGLNIPIRIGKITVLPGDVILGTPTGVIAIPTHLAELVAERSEDIAIRDRFSKIRLAEDKYASDEIDVSVWREDIEADFVEWRRKGDLD